MVVVSMVYLERSFRRVIFLSCLIVKCEFIGFVMGGLMFFSFMFLVVFLGKKVVVDNFFFR